MEVDIILNGWEKMSLQKGTNLFWPTLCNRRSAHFVTECITWRLILNFRKQLMSFGCNYDPAKPQ